MSGLSYESSGVNYDRLDAFKRACQRAAATTAEVLAAHGLSEPAGIRGRARIFSKHRMNIWPTWKKAWARKT